MYHKVKHPPCDVTLVKGGLTSHAWPWWLLWSVIAAAMEPRKKGGIQIIRLIHHSISFNLCILMLLLILVRTIMNRYYRVSLKPKWIKLIFRFYNSTKSWRGYIFTSVCLCVCVCVCLFVCLSVCLCVRNSCEQNSSRTDAPIWTRFSLNGCL